MGTEAGKRKLIQMLRLPDRHDQAPFAAGADFNLRALPHLSRHHLPRRRAGKSSQRLI